MKFGSICEFHHALSQVAKLLPIPRRYFEKGVRRYGFHGLSCDFIMRELDAIAGDAARDRIVLAHLGSGASITAGHKGKSIDTTMSFTPTSCIPMSTRSGYIDPGVASYLAHTENMSIEQFHHMINCESGLFGISETSSDLHELLLCQEKDKRAADAVSVFFYHTKKSICAMAGALGGINTLVFSGGIGENLSEIRHRICSGLRFLGVDLDDQLNASHAPIISLAGSAVTVRVIQTDEELVIARSICSVLRLPASCI